MPPKRPGGLSLGANPNPADESTGVSITNTLTLQVELPVQQGVGPSGEAEIQVRVKDDGVKRITESATDKINFEDLKVGHVLGEGTQAKVRKAVHKSGMVYALRQLFFSDDKEAMRKVLQTELRSVVLMPTHPHVVTSIEAFFRNGMLMILMEYMERGTLSNAYRQAGTIPENVLKIVALHLFSGLSFLHSQHIVHRDIKPSNLLVNKECVVKISDFGVSAYVQASKMHHTTAPVGSTPYMSPERVRGDPYSFPSDVWSAGVAIAECAVGFFPFGASLKSKTFELCSMIAEDRSEIQWGETAASAELKDFIQLCITHTPENRPSADTLLKHPFITSCNLEDAKWFEKTISPTAMEA